MKKFTPLHETEYFSWEADSRSVGEKLTSFYVTKFYLSARFPFGLLERAVVAYVLLGNDARSFGVGANFPVTRRHSPSDSAPNLRETGPFIITFPTA